MLEKHHEGHYDKSRKEGSLREPRWRGFRPGSSIRRRSSIGMRGTLGQRHQVLIAQRRGCAEQLSAQPLGG